MNYIKHLTGFFDKVARDRTLNPTHVSLYIALFQFWNYNRFKNPISISRDEVMRISKISSKATYHKCLHNLHDKGYIKYEPSYNPFRGSQVIMLNFADDLKPPPKTEQSVSSNFDTVGEQVVKRSQSGIGTSAEQVGEQAVVPSINNINITNNQNNPNDLNLCEPAKKIEKSNLQLNTETDDSKEKSSAKKEKVFHENESNRQIDNVVTSSAVEKPDIEEVQIYFTSQSFPELEANKFFNYFNSIGWLVGGKTKMVDWHSAAKNWMLNAPKYQPEERLDRTTTFDTSTNKDYGEPL